MYVAGLGGAGARRGRRARWPRSRCCFVVGRVVEGAGGAAVLACGLAVLAHRYPLGPERLHATSIWGASVGLGIGGGAVLAALLDVGSGWRPSYWVTAVAAVLLVVPSLRLMGESSAAVRKRVDVAGLVLLVAAMVARGLRADPGPQRDRRRDGRAGAWPRWSRSSGFVVVERRVDAAAARPRAAAAPAVPRGDRRLARPRRRDDRPGVVHAGDGAARPTAAGCGRPASPPWPGPGPAWSRRCWSAGSRTRSRVRGRSRSSSSSSPSVSCSPGASARTRHCGGSGCRWSWPARGPACSTRCSAARRSPPSPPDRAAMGSGANNTARYLGAAVGITLFVTVATHAGDTCTTAGTPPCWSPTGDHAAGCR